MGNIKEKIEQILNKLKSDKGLMEKFQSNPVSVVEQLLGIDLPDDQISQIVDGVKAKLKLDNIGSALGSLGGLFGKK